MSHPVPARPQPSAAALAVLRQLHEHNQAWDSVRGLELTRTHGNLIDDLVDRELVMHDHRTATWLALTPRGLALLEEEIAA